MKKYFLFVLLALVIFSYFVSRCTFGAAAKSQLNHDTTEIEKSL